MKKNDLFRMGRLGIFVVAMAVVAVVACGAAGKKNQGNTGAPLNPTTYDPRISLAPLVEKVGGAVVNIQTTERARSQPGQPGRGPSSLFEYFFGPDGQMSPNGGAPNGPIRQSTGSGFIIDASGYVVTNHHVVAKADEIEVILSENRKFTAKLVGSDERTDVALLKLEKASNLPFVTFGSSEKMRVGDRVVAIGNPFGLDHTVTEGIVSAKERVIGAGPYDEFIQTDASINPGNSGGPLFNLSGEVIGINTAISRTGQGIGFAIPSDLARGVIEDLKKDGRVTRGWLGVGFQPMNEELARALGLSESSGAIVTNVIPGSPADTAGIKSRDVIVAVNGKKLKTGTDLPSLVAALTPGKAWDFSLMRDGKPVTVKVNITALTTENASVTPTDRAQKSISSNIGINVVDLDERTRKQLGVDPAFRGVLVTGVDSTGKSARSLTSGDVITGVNRSPVRSVAEFEAAVKTTGSGNDLLLLVFRRGGWVYVVIRL